MSTPPSVPKLSAPPVADLLDHLTAVRDHVLIKGWHDQGGAEAVYGPYTKPYAEWLLAELLPNSTYNWTLIKLTTYGGPS